MSSGAGLEAVEAARGNAVSLDNRVHGEPLKSDVHVPVDNEKTSSESLSGNDSSVLRGPNGEEYPTAEELSTLERVKGPITWIIYTIAFIELCERFAYYGTTAVCECRPNPTDFLFIIVSLLTTRPKSSTLSRRKCQPGRPPAQQEPTGKPVLWVSASRLPPA